MPVALVVSGGGSKGAFAVGVIRELLTQFPHLTFDQFVGTSTGSLIVPLVAMGEMDLVEELYTTVETDNIIGKHNIGDRLSEHSIFDATPLWNLISEHYTDARCQALLNSTKKIYLTTTCLQTGELVVFSNDSNATDHANYRMEQIHTPDHLRKVIMASACQPVFMPPVKVNLKVPGHPHPHYQFVDGGVRQYVGIEMAIDHNATDIVTILLSPKETETDTGELKTLFPILEKTIDIFTTDVGKNDLIIPQQFNEALQYIAAVKNKMKREGFSQADIDRLFRIRGRENPYEDKKPLNIYLIRPAESLGGGPGGLNFDPAEMKQMLATGRVAAGNFMASLNPNDSPWA